MKNHSVAPQDTKERVRDKNAAFKGSSLCSLARNYPPADLLVGPPQTRRFIIRNLELHYIAALSSSYMPPGLRQVSQIDIYRFKDRSALSGESTAINCLKFRFMISDWLNS